MHILALNCGSSSIKCAVIDSDTGKKALELQVTNTGRDTSAIDTLLAELRQRWVDLGKIDAVVHRVVHGGERYSAPILIDTDVLAQLDALARLAPLHNPPATFAIRRARELFAHAPHVAVFDTAFHATLPRRAREYALPEDVRVRQGIRRYGFHGISHGDIATRVAAQLQRSPQELRVISCHLGNGASITAIEYGRSVETSMGMTPLEGLVMGTRAGDLDAGIVLELARTMPADALANLLNERSGLEGLTGTHDMRDIERRAAEGDEPCRLALSLYTHRIRKYLGAYAGIMGGVDAIAFTGGVGEHSALVRHRCLQRMSFLGAVLDEDRNRNATVSEKAPAHDVATDESRVRLLVLRADEERAMAAAAAKLLASVPRPAPELRIPIAVSARHAHLSQPTIEQLFGPGYRLRPKVALSQEGQFSAEETVRLLGPRGEIRDVRLMGPPRVHDQVEISRSDEFTLGIDAPVRISGDLANTPGVTLEGPHGRVTLTGGVICARRHIHMDPLHAG
ncbi:MAG TPA: acetate/propionate family kinase, partial [Steroidobacteraceae bacterium]|nr:acetate/propionate family kinase [Steroidobacteraceae bacterium]